MPDNADKALKLAQHVDRKLTALEKKLDKQIKDEAAHHKELDTLIRSVEKFLLTTIEMHSKLSKEKYNKLDKKLTTAIKQKT